MILSLMLLAGACHPPVEAEVLAIREVMEDQVEAWNQGDVRSYMEGYHESDQLIFTGGKSKTVGWQDALDRYLQAYPTKESMGQLQFNDLQIKVIAPKAAFATGQWVLDRSSDTLSGRFTLVWRKIGGKWRIIADHSS